MKLINLNFLAFEKRGVVCSLKSEKKNNSHSFPLQDANLIIIFDVLIPGSVNI